VSENVLVSVIREFAKLGGKELYISGGREPFSQPKIACVAITRGQQVGLRVKVYTNGIASALRDKSTQTLLALRTQQVRFSIHAIDSSTYRQIACPTSRDVNFSQAFNNIVSLMDRRSAIGRAEVGVGLVVLPENARELGRVGEFWRDMGVDFLDVRFNVIAPNDLIIQEEVKDFQRLAESGYFEPLRVSIPCVNRPCRFASKCHAAVEKIVVDPFGLVWCCCLLSNPGLRPDWAKVGNINHEPLAEIVARITDQFPINHCENCTPWEANYNLLCEGGGRLGRANTAAYGRSADKSTFRRKL